MPLSVWQRHIVDDSGNVQGGASIQVKIAGTTTDATIYDDRDGSVSLSNPFSADSNGFAQFYAKGGAYDIFVDGSKVWDDFPLGTANEHDVGKSIGNVPKYEDDGSGNPQIDGPNAKFDSLHGTTLTASDLTVTGDAEIQGTLTYEDLTVSKDAEIQGNLTVLQNTDLQGSVDVSNELTVGGFLQLNNDMDATGNIDADGFTINGTPVGTSTDTYWNDDGSGNIYYQSGNVLGNPIALNKYNITSNWKIPSGYHGMSVGPLDIDADITIAENSVWEVL